MLVGRGAQAVLATRPNALHVYVVASTAFKKKVAIERLGVSAAEVEKVMQKTDRQRDDTSNHITDATGRISPSTTSC